MFVTCTGLLTAIRVSSLPQLHFAYIQSCYSDAGAVCLMHLFSICLRSHAQMQPCSSIRFKHVSSLSHSLHMLAITELRTAALELICCCGAKLRVGETRSRLFHASLNITFHPSRHVGNGIQSCAAGISPSCAPEKGTRLRSDPSLPPPHPPTATTHPPQLHPASLLPSSLHLALASVGSAGSDLSMHQLAASAGLQGPVWKKG